MSQPPQPSTRPYRGKSPAVRQAEKLERILLGARDVFALRGYAGAGIEEIVAQARVSRTTFYEFFENKEECLLAVIELGTKRLRSSVLKAVMRQLGPVERIRAEVCAVAKPFAADPAMARVILIAAVGATAAAEDARVRIRHEAAAIIETQLLEYPYWRARSAHERRIASVAAMAAIAEPLSDLVATGRIADWETIVEPVTEFVARALIPK